MTAQQQGAWPFPDRPGTPLEPEKDGVHRLMIDGEECWLIWRAAYAHFRSLYLSDAVIPIGPCDLYLGPARTDADLRAARAEERELAVKEAAALLLQRMDPTAHREHAVDLLREFAEAAALRTRRGGG